MRFIKFHTCRYRTSTTATHRFVFFEQGQSRESLVNVIAKKEAELKKDVVKQENIEEKMQSIQKKVDTSPLDAAHKEKIKQELAKLHDAHRDKLQGLKNTTESSLKSAVATIEKDLQTFESRPEVAFLFRVISAPEFQEIQKQHESIQKLEANVKAKADTYQSHLMGNGELAPGHEENIEEYAVAIHELYAGMDTLVHQKALLTGSDPQRLQVLEKILGKKNTITLANFKGNPAAHGGVEASTSEIRIPSTSAELKNVQRIAATNILQIRSALYRTTGNPKYEEAYRQHCEMIGRGASSQSGVALEAVEETPENKAMKMHAREKLESLGAEFSALQALRGKDPVNAQRGAVGLLERLRGFTKGYKMVDADNDFRMMELKKYPEVEKAFHQGVDTYLGETENLILDATTNNPVMKRYQDEATSVTARTMPFIKSAETLFKQVQDGQGVPSENTMRMFHQEAQGILVDPVFNRLASADAGQFFDGLKIPDEAASPRLHEIMTKMKESQQKVTEYIRAVNTVTRQILAMKGHGVGLEAFFKDAAKYAAITAAAVAGAVAMGALVAASGGALAGPALFLANTAATSLGAAIGSNYMTAAIEGNTDAISTENMLTSWGQGALFSGAGALAGQALGAGLGKGAEQLSKAFNIAPGKILSAPSIREGIAASGLKGYIQQIASETKEEMFEDAMQRIGEGLAPNDPWLGFVFSLIPSASGKARDVLHHAGIERTVTSKGVEITYTNQAEAIQTLEKAHAPAAILEAIRLNRFATIEEGGITVVVQPVAAPNITTDASAATEEQTFSEDPEQKKQQHQAEFEKAWKDIWNQREGTLDMGKLREQAKKGEITWEAFKLRMHEVQHTAKETMSAIRKDISENRGQVTVAQIYEAHLKNSEIPVEQQQMIMATAVHMLQIREDTGAIVQQVAKEADPQGSLKNRIIAAMGLKNFQGNIEYKIVDGVLCIRCESEADYAKFFGNQESHTSTGVALTADQTGLGIGMIVVKPHVALSPESPVIIHELQHIYKQGSNMLEPETVNAERFLNQTKGTLLTSDGMVDHEAMRNVMQAEKEACKSLLKDEALAFLVTSHMSIDHVYTALTGRNGAYDYFGKKAESDLFEKMGIKEAQEHAKDAGELISAFFTEMHIVHEEYLKETERVVGALADSVGRLHQNGMSDQEARGYLRDYLMFVPVNQWAFALDNFKLHMEQGVHEDQYTPFLNGYKDMFGQYNMNSSFDAAIAVPYRTIMAKFEDLKLQTKDLPQEYQDKVNAYIEAATKNMNTYVKDGSRGNMRPLEQGLKRYEAVSVESLLSIRQTAARIAEEMHALPTELQKHYQERILKLEKECVKNTPLNTQPNLNALLQEESEIRQAEHDPALFGFVLEKTGYISGDQEVIDLLQNYKQKLDELGSLDAPIREAARRDALLQKYPEFTPQNNLAQDIQKLQTHDAELKDPKSVTIQALLQYVTGAVESIHQDRDSAVFENITRFDTEIVPNLESRDATEVARIYEQLVLKLGSTISCDEFKGRLMAYEKAVTNFTTLDALNQEGDDIRKQSAHNIRESLQNFMLEEIVEHGQNPEEVEASVRTEYEKIRQTSSVTINVHEKALRSIYADGEYKVYSELEDKHREVPGSDYLDRRTAIDQKIHQDARFVVGCLASQNGFDEFVGPAPFYGHGVMTLKPEAIQDRVVFFEGDSMTAKDIAEHQANLPQWLLRKWDNLASRKLDFKSALFAKALMESYLKRRNFTHQHMLYVEAHITAPVRVEDLQSVQYGLVGNDTEKREEGLRALSEDMKKAHPDAPVLTAQRLTNVIKAPEVRFRKGAGTAKLTNDAGF